MSASIPSVVQLRRATKIAAQIEKLEVELAALLGQTRAGARTVIALARSASAEPRVKKPRKPYVFSPEARAKILAAQAAKGTKQGQS